MVLVKGSKVGKHTGSSRLAQGFLVNLGVCIAYIFSYAVVTFALNPLQQVFLPDHSQHVSLVFLPSGVKVFSIIAFGGLALPGLLIGSLFCDYFFWGIHNLNLLGAVTVGGVGVYYLVVEISARLGVNIYFPEDYTEIPNPRQILLLGIFASALNGILSSAILADFTPYKNGGLLAIMYLLGDTAGLIVFTSFVWFVLKRL
jgi:hypothetical protein